MNHEPFILNDKKSARKFVDILCSDIPQREHSSGVHLCNKDEAADMFKKIMSKKAEQKQEKISLTNGEAIKLLSQRDNLSSLRDNSKRRLIMKKIFVKILSFFAYAYISIINVFISGLIAFGPALYFASCDNMNWLRLFFAIILSGPSCLLGLIMFLGIFQLPFMRKLWQKL